MAIALVQSKSGGFLSASSSGGGTYTTSAAGFDSPTTPGNLIVCVAWTHSKTTNATTIPSHSILNPVTIGFTWVAQQGSFGWSISSPVINQENGRFNITYIQNAPAMAPADLTTVAATIGATGSAYDIEVEFTLYEFAGVDAIPFDVKKTANSSGTSTPNPGTITTTADHDLIISAYTGNPSGANLSPGSGYTLGINAAVSLRGQAQYLLDAPLGANAPAFSGGTTANWGAMAQAFKASAIIPVTPILVLTPATLNFFALQGGPNPVSQNIGISNGNGGTLNWSIASDQAWLTVVPASGSDPATVAASIDITGLAVGVYTGNLTVTAAGATGSPQVVVVTLSISAPAPPPPDVTNSTAREPRNPVIMLRWSDDGGHTWSNEHRLDCGSVGQYKRRVIARRLGRARDRVYEIVVSDPVPWRIIEAYLNPRGGK